MFFITFGQLHISVNSDPPPPPVLFFTSICNFIGKQIYLDCGGWRNNIQITLWVFSDAGAVDGVDEIRIPHSSTIAL